MTVQTELTVADIKARYLDVPPVWTCPITGLKVPKRPRENLQYRERVLREARVDSGFRRELYTASSMSLLWWINTFAFTLRVFRSVVGTAGRQCNAKENSVHLPFITWRIQDEHLTAIDDAITTGYDLLTDKSRDMGATWDHLTVLFHKWLFESDRSFLLLSAKEDYVDSPGPKGRNALADPSTLFGKLDYLNCWVPEWMRPPANRVKLHFTNLANHSRIDGESTTATAGSSERRTAIFLDEMAKMMEAESIKRSTRDVSACRLPNSTPNGAGTTYSKWWASGSIKVFTMDWSCHPEKADGLYAVEDEMTGIIRLRSPWYDQEARLRSPKELAIEVDHDHTGSGDTFFESLTILKSRQVGVKTPRMMNRHIKFGPLPLVQIPEIIKRNQVQFVEVTPKSSGPWTFWFDLIDGRPDQTKNYAFAIDIGKGMGASNSVISVGCIESREKIAEWASAQYAPHDFAHIVAASAIWFGGANNGRRPIIVWESNGDPGIYFGRALVTDLQYPNVFFDAPVASKIRRGKPRSYGWHSTTDKKAELLGEYRRALSHGAFTNPSAIALDEAATFIEYPGGGIGPACLQMESATARKTHGDRVIADALLNMVFGYPRPLPIPAMVAPHNSFAGRYESWRREQRREKRGDVWSFAR